jgi:hypothetical protein
MSGPSATAVMMGLLLSDGGSAAPPSEPNHGEHDAQPEAALSFTSRRSAIRFCNVLSVLHKHPVVRGTFARRAEDL